MPVDAPVCFRNVELDQCLGWSVFQPTSCDSCWDFCSHWCSHREVSDVSCLPSAFLFCLVLRSFAAFGVFFHQCSLRELHQCFGESDRSHTCTVSVKWYIHCCVPCFHFLVPLLPFGHGRRPRRTCSEPSWCYCDCSYVVVSHSAGARCCSSFEYTNSPFDRASGHLWYFASQCVCLFPCVFSSSLCSSLVTSIATML